MKAFKLTIEESSVTDALVIADKGFYLQTNI
jgi:hypothetical protein